MLNGTPRNTSALNPMTLVFQNVAGRYSEFGIPLPEYQKLIQVGKNEKTTC